MALAPGIRLGAYEIVSLLGAGGMGEVYRARDTKLDREVAIKVLPELFVSDPERVARFQREAKTLASLNHPHIGGIYGFEDTDGERALILELVEGPTLADRIAQGPIPLDEALPIARQVAEALEAAHEAVIIHRDLKPANIKLRPDGTVKVLDFGLAKALEPTSAASPSVTASPTITTPAMMTGVGMILGTAAYMAPEQAKGRAADKRADIWAFGVVVYEMLTGTRLFDAEDLSETLAAVLTRDVTLTTLPPTTPTRLRALLRDCLIRDPRQRLRDIGDARIVLDKIIAGAPDDAAASAAVPSAIVPAWRRVLPWAAAAAFAVALGISLWAPWRTTPVPPETRLDIVTSATTQPYSFALSPDGRQIAFVASDDKASSLWLRPLSTTTAQPLAGTEGATYPFWSPDGRSVGFFAGGALKRLDLAGGVPQVLAPVTNAQRGTWNADGVIVFAPSSGTPLLRVAAAGGAAVAVTTLGPQQIGHNSAQFLPDGRRLLFAVIGSADTTGIYLGALDGRAPIRLTSTPSSTSFAYASPGFLLWVREGTLVAQKLDVDRAALVGEPVTLASGIGAVSVSSTGLVAYRTTTGAARQLTWFDRSGTAGGVVGDPDGTLRSLRVSPNGRRVAVSRKAQGNEDIWVLDGPRASRLTFDPAIDLYSVWSPDGARIVYASARTGIFSLFRTLTSGAGGEEPFLQTEQPVAPTSWSADGKFLLYGSIDPKTGSDLWVLPTSGNTGDRKPFVFLRTPFREASGEFSPDGRWVAYHSNETGRPEVYVRPFVPPSRDASADRPAGTNAGAAAPPGGQWQISTTGGISPMWRADGKELYYLNPDGALMAVPITITGVTLEPGAPVTLFPTRIYGGGADVQLGRQYDVTRDGRFLINTVLNEAAATITLLQNWQPEAKK